MRTCNCGSGLEADALNDARGIFVAYCCDKCIDEVKQGYRPEIFEDCQYECDEPIDEDSY